MNFKAITKIVATGSVDGVLTSAALLRLIGNANEVGLEFAQAFTVDRINPAAWAPGQKVALVDLAVNNRDESMTVAFVARLKEAGHEVVAVCDEHNREDWERVLGTLEGLIVEPQSQTAEGGPGSSGEVLRRALEAAGMEVDSHTSELLSAADAADRMVFEGLGALVNQSVKSAIADDTRRVYLARHLAENQEADSTIQGWIKEYEVILANHQEILDAKSDLGDGITRVNAIGHQVDMTTLMSTLYRSGARVVALEGEAFNKSLGRKTRQISFGTADKGLDLLAVVKAAVPSASGFAQKANVDPEHEEAALAAIRAAIK
ncbi:MAG: hypothetical protein WC045_01800 [Patescibacteria group bacterium]